MGGSLIGTDSICCYKLESNLRKGEKKKCVWWSITFHQVLWGRKKEIKPSRLDIPSADRSVNPIVQAAIIASVGIWWQLWSAHLEKKQQKWWTPAAVGRVEGCSEDQRLSVIFGLIGKRLSCLVWQSRVWTRLEMLWQCSGAEVSAVQCEQLGSRVSMPRNQMGES